MEMMKRVLALLLTFAMLMPNLTTIASAAEIAEEPSVVSTEPVVAEEETEETVATESATEALTEPSAEETETPTEETEAPAEETEAPVVQEIITVEDTVTAPVADAQADGEPALVTETLTVEDTVAPGSAYSNDDMFGMYLDRLLYPNKPSTLGTAGFDSLPNAAHQKLYAYLKDKLSVVASSGGSTQFTLSTAELAEMGFMSTISAEEMGIAGQTDVTNAMLQALVAEKLALNLSAVVSALLADCPYELYWYDKLTGCNLNYSIGIAKDDAGAITVAMVDKLKISFTVADNYIGDGDLDVDSAYAEAAAQTVEKAAAVVAQYAALPNEEKLHAYKQWIMDAVCYNHNAANTGNFATNNDPWQLIHVFDEDDTTNVVCEGYSKAFQYLCDLSEFTGDVVCYSIIGYAGGAHMWNIVSIDGRNYMVDVTNTDPSEEEGKIAFGQGEEEPVFLAGTSGSIADGYTFTNEQGHTLTYTYYFADGNGATVHPSVDVHGDDEDSVLNLSFIGYEDYQNYSAAQKDMLENGDLSGDVVIVDSTSLHELGNVSGLNLTVSGATLVLNGYTELNDSSVTLENGARLLVQGELCLNNTALTLNDGTYLQIDGDQDNAQGRIMVNDGGSVTAADSAHILIPDGAVYVGYWKLDTVTGVEPGKLSVRYFVSNENELRDAVNAVQPDEGTGKIPYARYEAIVSQSFAVTGDIEIPYYVTLQLNNWGDVNDTVALTIAEGVTFRISGCYFAVNNGTQLRVEGILEDHGYLRTHAGSSVNVTGNGVLKVLDGTLDNQGIVYAPAADRVVTSEEDHTDGIWEGNEPIFAGEEMDSYISLRFLNNDGNGHWYEDSNSDVHESVQMAPGEHFYMIAYLNQWNEDEVRWEVSPIHATKLVADGNLVLEPFSRITDGSNRVWDGENVDAFFRVYAAEGKIDTTAQIVYSNTDIKATVNIGRHAGGFYSADPTAEDADPNALWLDEFCVSGENKTFYFYFDPSKYHEEGWSVSGVTASADRDIGADVRVAKVNDNLYSITVSDDTAANIYALREFWLHLDYTIVKGEDSRNEGADVRCRAGDFGDGNATFVIDGVRYHASWNYDGLFKYERDENGEYPVPAEVAGVSYDIESNTLTLNGARLSSLHINHYWYDENSGNEGFDLPDSRFNINLVGSNSISATNGHALLVSNDVYLTITGDGSLEISLDGDENNTCHSAFSANNSDVTIAGNAKVTVNISGEGYYEENGEMHRGNMNPIWGNGADRWLRLRDNATLTTNVPEGVCVNGHFDQNGDFVENGSFNGIAFFYIEVNDNATLNTQTIRVWDEGLGNAYGAYYQNGGTVNITASPHYNKDNQNENGTVGHYHYSGLEADYGQIEINGGELNIGMSATAAQQAKSAYFHGLQSRGRRIRLNGGVINITSNFQGTGIKVGEDNWDGGTNAWLDFNGCTLNMTGSKLYRCAIDVAPNGSINFNGGQINAHRADLNIRGNMNWNGTSLNQTEAGINVVGSAMFNGGYLSVKNGFFHVQEGSNLAMYGGYAELDNSFVYIGGNVYMDNGALIQSMDYRKLTTDADFVQALVIGRTGRFDICGNAYLEVTGIGNADGIYNEGTFRQYGGSVNVGVDETVFTAALFGPGKNRFENGNVYLEGYNGLVQFNQDYSELYVGGNTVMNAFGRDAAIVTYAPAVFEGGSVHAYVEGPVRTVEDEEGNQKTIYPYAVIVENNEDGTNASLTIGGGSHHFETYGDGGTTENTRGLAVLNAPITFEGGNVTIDAEMAVYNVTEGTESTVKVPVIVSKETGAVLGMTYDDTLKAYTLLGNVGFLTSQNCGENVQWNLIDGVLTISGTGAMDNYHMPISDPASWRVAPWYAMGDSITKVVVEEGVTDIGDWAFGRLLNVEEIVYPSTVTSIDMTSSYACPKLEKFTVAEGNETYSVTDNGKVLVENDSLVRAAVKSITSYKAGDNIRTIGVGAFDSTALEELDLNQVEVIQNYAFADCYDLKAVVIPEGVTTIEMTVFQNSGLESITIPASVTKIRNYAFDGCTALADVYYAGTESQWSAVAIGSGNNALTSVPITFMGTSEEVEGEPYLSYRLLRFGDQGYYEDMGEALTEMTVPVGFYTTMVVYSNVWDGQKWERQVVDPERLYSTSGDLEIGPFRYYEGIGIEAGEPNGEHFFEMAFHSGWGETRELCYDIGNGVIAKLPVTLTRSQVGFYSADPTSMTSEQRNAAWLNMYRINPNVSGHSVYFALTEYNGDFTSVQVDSNRLTAEDLEKVVLTKINGSVYQITLPDAVAAKVYDYRGIPIQVTYTIGEQTETVEFVFGSVSFAGACYSFVINGVWYEYYPGLEGYFSWDNANQKRLAYKELPGGITYDYENDVLTMNNSSIESLQVYWNWHDENTGDSGFATKDSDLTLKLIGKNEIVNPNSNSALAVGDGLTLTITGDADSSLLVSATNANATANNYSQNAVNIYNNADLVIAGDTTVTTSISSNEKMTNGWLMNMWGGGNNTLTIKDNATLNTTVPADARDDGDAYVNGYEGIGWFGEVRVQDNAALNTSSFGLGEYYDENNTYRGKGAYIQTGGTVTIEALGSTNEEGRHNYNGFMIQGGTSAQISGGKLIVKANAANVAADNPGEEGTTYAWFCGIQANGHLEISGENTVVEIQLPNDGTGLELANAEVCIRDGAVMHVIGGESDNYALNVNWRGNFQLQGGSLEFENAKVRIMGEGNLEIHDGVVEIDNGMSAYGGETLGIRGNVNLYGGAVTVTGNNALAVSDGGCLNQNGTVLTVNGLESSMTAENGGSIFLNGGNTVVTMGESGEDINNWYSAVNIYDGGYLEVNDGFHRFQVAGDPGHDADDNAVWLCALDVRGHVNFNGGNVELDAGSSGQALWNRETGNSTIGFNNAMGAVALTDGVSLFLQDRGNGSFGLGRDAEDHASNAVVMRTDAGSNSSWRIEHDGSNTTLIISGDQDMYNYYMPEGEAESDWVKTPWYAYKDQITHVVVEDGINHIGDWVFARMTKLVNVMLPGSVNHISTSAFYGCGALESFTMPGNDHYRLAEGTDNVIIEGGWKVLLAAPSVTEFTVSGDISEIGSGAFQNCSNLTSITFATNNVHTIGNNAFENTPLTEITIPEGVKVIGRSAYANCGAVTAISLPATVNTIRPYAFSGCGSVDTVTFAGSQADWSGISIGTGNTVLDKVTFQQDAVGGEDYLSFRWLNMGENGWEENENQADTELHVPAGMTIFGVFYYNHWDEASSKWTAIPVIPTGDNSLTIEKIDADMMDQFGWQIAEGETNSAYFVRMITGSDSWDTETVNNGIVTYNSVTMDMNIRRGEYGFYSGETASDAAWLNDYEMNPLKKANEFYFVFENSEDRVMEDSSFHIWNHNGIPASYIKTYDMGDGIFKIVLDPVFMQDAWRYGNGFQLWVGFDVKTANSENPEYRETNLQLKTLDLGSPDAILDINDTSYLYFKDYNGWMTYGDPANDWRPGVANIPAGVSYDAESNTLTLNNADLNNLSLRYRVYDGEGKATEETCLPNADLTIDLVGSSVIETGHRSALDINGDLNVTVEGTGSLRLHSHNDPENRDENGNRYAFDTVVVENGSTLTIAGGTVNAEVTGEGYWHEGNPAMPAALRGRYGSSLVISGGSLTTEVPENARDNGPEEVDFEHYYSTHAISEFDSITVCGGTLNTTSLYLNHGENYKQSGGTVNITGLGHMSWQWDHYGNQYRNYHYNGIQMNEGAKAAIIGGLLNLTVTPRDWEHGSGSFYNGLSIAGGEAVISGDATIRVTGAYEGNAISVGHDYDENGQPCANGTLTMDGGTLTVFNEIPGSSMNGVEVSDNCTAEITGGTLLLTPENSFAGINNMGDLTIGGAEVNLNQCVWSNGILTINGTTKVNVLHADGTDMYAWDIVPGSVFNFESGTITATNAAFMIGGEMNIGENAKLELTDSDFHADGVISLDGGSLTMTQEELVDNQFLGTVSDEWGNTWDNYKHQSRLYVTGVLNLNSGELTLQNTPMNMEGSAVVNQNGAAISLVNETAAPTVRETNDVDSDDWMVSAYVRENATLNINGGSFTVNNTGFNTGMEVSGTLNLRNGALTIAAPGGIALAACGQTNVSGGDMILSGAVGYQHWYEDGFEQGKLNVAGGKLDIDAVDAGIDLYNNMAVTGGEIDIDVSGRANSFTNENGVPVTVWVGNGITAYNDVRPISISINGGLVDINVPVDAENYDGISAFGMAGFRNGTIRINGGDVRIQGRTALYAESEQNSKHILINNRMYVLSMDTGNTLDISSGVVEVNRDGETYTWYVDTYEEDETFTTPYNNDQMEGYATNVRLVSKSAGTNVSWDMENGTLTISAPSDTVGAMVKAADWNLVADKVIRLVLDPSVTQPEDLSSVELPNLKTVKTSHNTPAAGFTNVTVEYFHQPEGDKQCIVEGCALATFTNIVESEKSTTEKVQEVQQIDNEALKQELESSATSAEQFEQLDEQAKVKQTDEGTTETLEVVVKAEENTAGETQKPISEILDVPEDATPKIVGAAMNAEETSKEVALVIGESSQEAIDETQYEKVVRFSMELTTTTEAEEETTIEDLKAPVKITLPLPTGMDPDRLVILHYHGEGEPEEVSFTSETVDGQVYVSFWVTGFSDFDFRMHSRTLRVVLENKNMTYGDAVPELTWKVLDEKNEPVTDYEDKITVNAKVEAEAEAGLLNAGTYRITAQIEKAEGVNCKIEMVPGILTVAKKQYTVTMDSAEMTIGDTVLPELSYSTSDDLPDGITILPRVEGIATAEDVIKAGEYVITANPIEYANCIVKIEPGILTVGKQAVTVIMDDQTMKLGEIQPDLTYTVKHGDTILENHGLDITPKIESFASDAAGTYTITALVKDSDRYEVTLETGTMTVIGKFGFAGTTMTLGSELAMNFWLKIADLDGTGYYAKIEKTYADGTSKIVTIPYESWRMNGTAYIGFTFNGIAAKEMSDKIYVTIYDNSGLAVSEQKTDSIQDYITRNLSDWDDETKTMGVDMLNYGAAAQIQFTYDVNNLANAGIGDYQQYATQTVDPQDSRVQGTNYAGSTLTLKNEISLRLYFKNITRDMTASIRYTNHYGESKAYTVQGKDFIANGNYFGVTVDTLVVADVGTLVSCEILDADGNLIASASDSVESYIARMESTGQLYIQIMRFAESAYAFFHKGQ